MGSYATRIIGPWSWSCKPFKAGQKVSNNHQTPTSFQFWGLLRILLCLSLPREVVTTVVRQGKGQWYGKGRGKGHRSDADNPYYAFQGPKPSGMGTDGRAWESNFPGAAWEDCSQAPWPVPSTSWVSPGQVPWGNKIGNYGTHIQICRQNEENKFPWESK